MCPIIHGYVPWAEGHHQGLGYLAVRHLDLRELLLYWCLHGSGASTLCRQVLEAHRHVSLLHHGEHCRFHVSLLQHVNLLAFRLRFAEFIDLDYMYPFRNICLHCKEMID
jgi:hypothetical protein